jgi:hypothetical protein
MWNVIEEVPPDRIRENGELIHNLVSEMKKGRLCSNTRDLNLAARKLPLKMESIKDVRQRLKKNNWLFPIDLSKFYWTMSINPAHRRYFRFRMEGKLYQWKALPFGYVNSMQIMSRILAPVIQKLATMGIETIYWVDDLILQLGEDKEKARNLAADALSLLSSLGFVINAEKTARDVTKEVLFRGFRWNTKTETVIAPAEKLANIRKAAKKRSTVKATARQIAGLVGKVRYIAQVHPHVIAWIVELEILKTKALKKGWDIPIHIPPEAKEEILHWRWRDTVIPSLL